MINNILNKYLNNEKSGIITNYSLDGITKLLSHLKNPHNNFKSLHIAGTNGKGTTANILAKILERSGYKTGLFTSPHLIKINERIKINSIDIDDEIFYNYISRIDKIITNDFSFSPTYFDIITAAAFAYFKDESVEIAVIETGLGGRLDSTNVITPEISIITDISMDHIDILGDNISDITKEKCGIIKPGIPVITSNINSKITEIIQVFSGRNKSKLYSYKCNFNTRNIKRAADHFVFDYYSDDHELLNIKLPLFPIHQVMNCAVAITALNHLKSSSYPSISNEIILEELGKIKISGRFQILNRNPLIIYDPAHNFESIHHLIEGIDEFYPGKKKIFILSIMNDKAEHKTLELFSNLDVVYYLLNDERAYIPGKNQFKFTASDVNIIVDILENETEDYEMIIFTGTFRMYYQAVSTADLFKKKNILNIINQVESC